MQPDTEDTSAQYDTREGAYVLAMDSILELLRTQDSKDRDAIIQKTTLLLHVADVFEPFITLYNLDVHFVSPVPVDCKDNNM